jgi:DNA ligase-1
MKPMLAGKVEDVNNLNYPVIASPKLDGIRTICSDTFGVVTRNLKPIPNKISREKLEILNKYNLDGEIIVGNPTAKEVFQVTSSGIMSHSGEPNFTYYVFDTFNNPDKSYKIRVAEFENSENYKWVKILESRIINNAEELLNYEAELLEKGYEGVMVPNGKYKFGRSTTKEGILLKLKQFEDCEVEVIGFEEKMTNENEATKDALGHSKRSSHQAGKVAANTLGAIIVNHPTWGTFNVGSGFDDVLRDEIWNNKSKYIGASATVKYQAVGCKDKPRFPIFKGFRKDI